LRHMWRKVPPGRKLFPLTLGTMIPKVPQLTLRTMILKVPQIVYNEKRR
jgi:hypothetical protein